jgi:hypothetical protein
LSFTPATRDRNTVIGGNTVNFNTVGSPPNINDLDNGRRPGTYEDLVRLVKLNHSLGVAHMMGGSIVEPMDLPVPTRHLDNAYALLRYTDRAAFVRSGLPSSGPWTPLRWCRLRVVSVLTSSGPSARWSPRSTSTARAGWTRNCSMVCCALASMARRWPLRRLRLPGP